MTALTVAKEALQRKESSGPKALAKKAAKEGSTVFTVPEVQYSISHLLATLFQYIWRQWGCTRSPTFQ